MKTSLLLTGKSIKRVPYKFRKAHYHTKFKRNPNQNKTEPQTIWPLIIGTSQRTEKNPLWFHESLIFQRKIKIEARQNVKFTIPFVFALLITSYIFFSSYIIFFNCHISLYFFRSISCFFFQHSYLLHFLNLFISVFLSNSLSFSNWCFLKVVFNLIFIQIFIYEMIFLLHYINRIFFTGYVKLPRFQFEKLPY